MAAKHHLSPLQQGYLQGYLQGWWHRLGLSVFALALVAASSSAEASPQGEPVHHHTLLPAKVLKVGEDFNLSLRPGQKIFISRKGFLAIHQLSPEKFRLIALKKGELVVLVKGRGDEVLSQRTVVIRARMAASQPKTLRLPRDCSAAAIRCRQGIPPMIAGMANSWQQFFALRSWCQKHRCDFRLMLSPRARRNYEQFVTSNLGDRYPHAVLENGVLAICQSSHSPISEIRQILDGDLRRLPMAQHSCQKGGEEQNYDVEAIVFRLQQEDAKRYGLDIAGQTFPLSAEQSINLHAFLAQNQSRVVGHPTMRMVAGQVSEFATGSEFYVADSEGRGQWKQVGFAIKLKVSPLAGGALQVWYHVAITGPKSGGAQHLDSSTMSSTMTALLGQPQVVAQLNTTMSSRHTKGIPVVDSLPIIGPLLRQRVNANSQSRLFLWLKLDRAHPQNLLGNAPRDAPKALRLRAPLLTHRQPAFLE